MSGWDSSDIAALQWADEPLRWQRSLRWREPARCGWGIEPRATADELCAMRADPPMPAAPKPDDDMH
jgi:hypothetical protein